MPERIVLSELKKAKAARSAKPVKRTPDEEEIIRLWARRVGGAILGCGVAALIYKLAHAQSASAFVWLRDPYELKVDITALTHMVGVYMTSFFFGALAGGALARGRILFSITLALFIVLAVAVPFRASEISGGLGPTEYVDPNDKEAIALIYRASHLIQLVEMGGAFVVASLSANVGSKVSRWIVKEERSSDV